MLRVRRKTPVNGRRGVRWRAVQLLGCLSAAGMAASLAGLPAVAGTRPAQPGGMSPVTEASQGCSGQNAEVEEATAPPRYVYQIWIGCHGIGFARSTDGGLHYAAPVTMPDTAGVFSWDPSIAVAPDGTVYAAYMVQDSTNMFPVVAASFDHGASFTQITKIHPPVKNNWGDRDFIAVGRNGDVYVTWDYGPSAAEMKFLCSPTGSCAYAAGDVNAVIQKSTDGGRTFGPIISLAPGFPRNGGYSAPLVVQPNGRVDVLDWGHSVDAGTYKIHPGHEYFTSSRNGTTWPAKPLELWPGEGSIALPTWWIDGDISRDAAGHLYVTWDTQASGGDIGWLSYSTDGGRTWSSPVRVTPDHDNAMHDVEVAGGRSGIAYVAWQTDASPQGYATWLRPYSISRGWLGPAIRVSTQYGNDSIWPGDTFGLAVLHGGPGVRLALSWGSAVGGSKDSEIYARVVTLPAAR